LIPFDRVCCISLRSFLVRNWCGDRWLPSRSLRLRDGGTDRVARSGRKCNWLAVRRPPWAPIVEDARYSPQKPRSDAGCRQLRRRFQGEPPQPSELQNIPKGQHLDQRHFRRAHKRVSRWSVRSIALGATAGNFLRVMPHGLG
jgi:hypothetical protein